MRYLSGLDRFMEGEYKTVKGKKVGLVTNHTGIDKDCRHNVDLLFSHPEVNLVCLFGPEHGVRGSLQDGEKVVGGVDKNTGLPIYSLYGEEKKPAGKLLRELEGLIFDLQDVGVRFYTYLSTLLYVLESCAEHKKTLIVLDRLNPLGRRVEGNIPEAEFRSFIGLYPIPQRHGMTLGELACWANDRFHLGADLQIIKVQGWHGEYFDQMRIPWIPPSPNIPHFATALVYPVTCMFEGTNVSEGRGTANPFEYIGAPWIDGDRLVKRLNSICLPGVKFRPTYFTPTFSKYKEQECQGVQVMIEDREQVQSLLTGLTILQVIKALYPHDLKWLPSSIEAAFDFNMGTDKVRLGIEQGREPADIVHEWRADEKSFISEREKYLLY